MLSTKIRTIFAVAVAVAALALPASALARDPVEWTYSVGQIHPAQPAPGTRYDLVNYPQYENRFPSPPALVYGLQQWGGADVDFAWPNGNPQWKFVRQATHPRTSVITGSERVALYNAFEGRYLVYGHQTLGVSLDWSTTPNYQWQVASGTRGAAGGLVELYNTQEQAYLVYDHQTFGIDLGWLHAPFSLPPGYVAPQPLIGSTVAPVGSLSQARLIN
jgi:hypothetical protein